MYRTLALACVLGAAWSGASAAAQAQVSPYANIYNRPTVSPYLNLLQTNQFGITPYHTLVRPQLEAREALQQQGSNIQRLQQQQARQQQAFRGARGGMGTLRTGHETRFMNYSHYYTMPR